MPSLYSSSRGSGGSIYRKRGRPRPYTPPKKKGRSVGGFIGNIWGDVAETVVGIPRGVYETARHPIRSGKVIGRSYAEMYGPLAKGDVGRFLQNLYEHPLGPALDVLTVATLGAGGAARGASLLGKAGKTGRVQRVQLRSPGQLAREGQLKTGTRKERAPIFEGLEDLQAPLTIQGKTLSRNPLIRGRQKAVDRLLKKLPATTPYMGEVARFGRELDRIPRREAEALKTQMRRYNRSVSKLGKEEMAALHLIGRGVSPGEWEQHLKRNLEAGGKISDRTMRVLANPKIRDLYDRPQQSKRLSLAIEEARRLSELDAAEKMRRGWLTPERARERLYLHARLASGAKLELDEADNPVLVGGKTIEEIQAALEERPPLFYVPDRMTQPGVANANLARKGGGLGVPKLPVQQNRAILFNTGRLALGDDVLGPEFMRTLKVGLFDDVHSELLSSAVRVPKGGALPKGYVYVRRRQGRTSTEKIPATEKLRGEFERDLEELLPDPNAPGLSELADQGLTTRVGNQADEHLGYRLIVPERLARQVAGEFTRSSKVIRDFWDKPTAVWRAITLGYRPAFLVNNLVGNHLLFAIKMGGLRAIAGYVDAIRTIKGPRAAARLLNDPKTRHLIDQDFIDQWFPEFAGAGTFMETQMPRIGGPRTRRAMKVTGGGLMQPTQAASETFLRRAAVGTVIRKNPDVRRVLKNMPRQERSWRAAAEKAFEDDPGLVREVGDQVNGALGDYLSLSTAERTYVRSLIPFWAWYRAILTITARMPLDTPGRANVLANVGRVGAELEEGAELPRYLKGGIPLGDEDGGLQPVLTTTGLNPFRTIEDLGRSATVLVGGQPGEAGSSVGSMLNPFAQGMIEQLTGRSLFSGAPLSPETGNPIQDWIMRNVPGVAAVPARTAGEVPQTSIWTGPSQLYPERDKRAQILALLGVPVKRYSIAEARERWLREQTPQTPY